METVTIHEYLIDNDKVIQLTHQAEARGNKYVFKAGKSKYLKILSIDELGTVISNHVFALEDNFKKYRNLIIQCLEERVTKEKQKLKRDEELLFNVKCAAVREDTGFDADVIGCYMSNYKVPNVCPVATGGWCKNYTTCKSMVKEKTYTDEEQSLIDGVEFAKDWQLAIPPEDYEKYIELVGK